MLVAVIVAVVALAAGFGIGWYAHMPASSASVIPPIASAFANATPGVTAPSAAEEFEGSTLVMNAISNLSAKDDIAISADYRLIASMLEPTHATWEVAFATDPC
jgi:ABC-type molybdate transport system substrate-binding protein